MLFTSIQRLSAYTSLSKRLRWIVRAVRQSYDSICGKKRYNSQLGKFYLQIFPNWELLIIFVSTNISNMRLTGSEKLDNLCRKYRLVVVVVFAFGRANIRFAGTHKEYDKIKDIKNI